MKHVRFRDLQRALRKLGCTVEPSPGGSSHFHVTREGRTYRSSWRREAPMPEPITPETALAIAMQSPGHLGPEAAETWFASSGMIHRTRLLAATHVISTLSLLGFEVRAEESSADAVRNVLGRCLPDAEKEPHLVAERREVLAKGGAT